jgi:hypothetical protein
MNTKVLNMFLHHRVVLARTSAVLSRTTPNVNMAYVTCNVFYEALKVALRRIMALEGPPKALEHGRWKGLQGF